MRISPRHVKIDMMLFLIYKHLITTSRLSSPKVSSGWRIEKEHLGIPSFPTWQKATRNQINTFQIKFQHKQRCHCLPLSTAQCTRRITTCTPTCICTTTLFTIWWYPIHGTNVDFFFCHEPTQSSNASQNQFPQGSHCNITAAAASSSVQ